MQSTSAYFYFLGTVIGCWVRRCWPCLGSHNRANMRLTIPYRRCFPMRIIDIRSSRSLCDILKLAVPLRYSMRYEMCGKRHSTHAVHLSVVRGCDMVCPTPICKPSHPQHTKASRSSIHACVSTHQYPQIPKSPISLVEPILVPHWNHEMMLWSASCTFCDVTRASTCAPTTQTLATVFRTSCVSYATSMRHRPRACLANAYCTLPKPPTISRCHDGTGSHRQVAVSVFALRATLKLALRDAFIQPVYGVHIALVSAWTLTFVLSAAHERKRLAVPSFTRASAISVCLRALLVEKSKALPLALVAPVFTKWRT